MSDIFNSVVKIFAYNDDTNTDNTINTKKLKSRIWSILSGWIVDLNNCCKLPIRVVPLTLVLLNKVLSVHIPTSNLRDDS